MERVRTVLTLMFLMCLQYTTGKGGCQALSVEFFEKLSDGVLTGSILGGAVEDDATTIEDRTEAVVVEDVDVLHDPLTIGGEPFGDVRVDRVGSTLLLLVFFHAPIIPCPGGIARPKE